mmetsp:Transcript_6779/g.13436  ORF Transcript_6779/g.13436 Transcript_6779/m.13436 type:complete len:228 (-) Transcript_6779:572-1255(-)
MFSELNFLCRPVCPSQGKLHFLAITTVRVGTRIVFVRFKKQVSQGMNRTERNPLACDFRHPPTVCLYLRGSSITLLSCVCAGVVCVLFFFFSFSRRRPHLQDAYIGIAILSMSFDLGRRINVPLSKEFVNFVFKLPMYGTQSFLECQVHNGIGVRECMYRPRQCDRVVQRRNHVGSENDIIVRGSAVGCAGLDFCPIQHLGCDGTLTRLVVAVNAGLLADGQWFVGL